MENASKALLIAGGILLALIIVTFMLYVTGHINSVKQSEYEKTQIEQLQKFNQEYEVYNKKLLYGAEVISVINKIYDNNKRYEDDSTFWINYYPEELSVNNIEKTDIYTCISIQYNSETGRVQSMTFQKYEQ